jgi:type IV secretion system protein VirB6
MIASCPTIGDEAGVAERLAGYIECQSAQIDLAAFQGGLWHGLPTALVSALMVLYVAGIGYRLILHRDLDVAGLVYAALRLGVVIAVATTLSAYSALFYTVATQGPMELAAMALAPAGLQAPSPSETSHAAAEDLASLAGAEPKGAPPAPATSPTAGGDPSAKPPASAPAGPAPDLSGAVFLISCVGFSLAARLAQAVVLAAGPLFIAAALFDVSAGLFIGWLRVLVALFLAQAGYAVSAALELSFFAQELERAASGTADTGAPLMVGMVFLFVGTAITVAAILAGGGLPRLDVLRRLVPVPEQRAATAAVNSPSSPRRSGDIRLDYTVPRAQRITDAVGALAVAEDQRQNSGREIAAGPRAGAPSAEAMGSPAGAGSGLRRPGQLRASTSAARRDEIS